MTFVSYAQNFEDVMLWRALGHVPAGFYIDVGAWDPDLDSVTRAFYDQGWSGINIEPLASAAQRLSAARPRDVTLQLAVGERAGRAAFFAVDGTGLSTLEPAALALHGGAGHAVQRAEVEVETLAEICRRHAPETIHFLKIDAEGAERAVLAGADFTRFRPWVVLIEATAPLSQSPSHGEWEDLILAAGYGFAWFDGLNRFYLADERREALAPAFAAPPNVFDQFVRAADPAAEADPSDLRLRDLRDRVREAESRGRVADDRANTALLRLAVQSAHAAQARSDAAHARAELDGLRHQVAVARAQAHAAAEGERTAAAWLAALRGSTSWRVTAPLRRVAGLAARRGAVTAPTQTVPLAAPAAAPPAHPPARRLPLRTVHQFHSGSATGDAITNAMLMTRTLLRTLGYRSDIYVEHRDPALALELRLLDELPEHGEYVLLLAHSMGYDAFARIEAVAAPKVLIYHNITPPEFLEHAPVLQQYAALGRTQLERLRPLVAAALADSEYNAIELRRLGFDPVQACPLLFDTRRLARPDPAPKHPGAPFTILFVGRIIASKSQHELLEAFVRFTQLYGRPARLVLVGRYDNAGMAYLERMHDLIRREQLDTQVVLTGFVTDAELLAWYGRADLYVSVSQHEGFGVPLVEAMAHGVPVLAWPAGAVPYTLDGGVALLADPEPSAVAEAMLAMAHRLRDPAQRADLLGRQAATLQRFSLDRQVPALVAALARAGAAPPPDPSARAALAANLHFTIMGHLNGSYSLAAANRDLAAAIDAARPGAVRLLPVEGAPTTDLSRVPLGCRATVARLAGRRAPATGPAVGISNHYPFWPPADRGDLALAWFFWEESVVPGGTVAALDAGCDGVLAPSAFVAKTLIDSGLSRPVRVIGHAPALERFRRLRAERGDRAEAAGPFTFLHVSSCFPRKGVDVLLAAYARAFRAGDPVRLVLKGFPNPHNDAAAQLAALRATDPDLAAIELIDRDLDADALLELYRAADAIVLPTRGEGFNLPAAEAIAAGIPLIVTGFGGHMDFCRDADPSRVRLLGFHFAPATGHLASPHSVWAEPDRDDLAAALRAAVARGRQAPTGTEPALEPAACVAALTEASLDLLLAPPRPPVRIACVTSWGVRCGVAEYSRQLLEALPANGRVAAVTVLADDRAQAGSDARLEVRPCWRLGDNGARPGLAHALLVTDPDIVVVQHQPGLLTWTALTALLTDPALAGRTVCTTLHNTLHLLDIAAAERDAAVAALAGIARVVVHTVADLNRLRGWGLVANLAMLPHGAAATRPSPPPRLLTPDQPALIGCTGFLLPGKGVPELIAALAELRRTWPGARLRLVTAEHADPDSAAELARCRTAAASLGDAVEFVTEFLAPERCLALLAECDIVALPHQASKEASSAALRTALASGRPVLATNLPLFDEAAEAVARTGGVSPASIAAGLAELLPDLARRERLVAAGAAWLDARAWGGVAARMQGMLLGLSAAGPRP